MSEDKFYHIKRREGEERGIVVKLNGRALECLTGGDAKVTSFGATCKEGELVAKTGYFLIEVSEEQALNMQKSYENWRLTPREEGEVR